MGQSVHLKEFRFGVVDNWSSLTSSNKHVYSKVILYIKYINFFFKYFFLVKDLIKVGFVLSHVQVKVFNNFFYIKIFVYNFNLNNFFKNQLYYLKKKFKQQNTRNRMFNYDSKKLFWKKYNLHKKTLRFGHYYSSYFGLKSFMHNRSLFLYFKSLKLKADTPILVKVTPKLIQQLGKKNYLKPLVLKRKKKKNKMIFIKKLLLYKKFLSKIYLKYFLLLLQDNLNIILRQQFIIFSIYLKNIIFYYFFYLKLFNQCFSVIYTNHLFKSLTESY